MFIRYRPHQIPYNHNCNIFSSENENCDAIVISVKIIIVRSFLPNCAAYIFENDIPPKICETIVTEMMSLWRMYKLFTSTFHGHTAVGVACSKDQRQIINIFYWSSKTSFVKKWCQHNSSTFSLLVLHAILHVCGNIWQFCDVSTKDASFPQWVFWHEMAG